MLFSANDRALFKFMFSLYSSQYKSDSIILTKQMSKFKKITLKELSISSELESVLVTRIKMLGAVSEPINKSQMKSENSSHK